MVVNSFMHLHTKGTEVQTRSHLHNLCIYNVSDIYVFTLKKRIFLKNYSTM